MTRRATSWFTPSALLVRLMLWSSSALLRVAAGGRLRPYHHDKFRRMIAEDEWTWGHHYHQRRRLQRIADCKGVTEWFTTRWTNGVNVLDTFYDCDCSGDFDSAYTLSCQMENYCYQKFNGTSEICVNHHVTYSFAVVVAEETMDNSVFVSPTKGYICIDYLKGGPSPGLLCFVPSAPCALRLKDFNSFSTEHASHICTNATACQETLETLGYSDQQVHDLCPTMKLNDIECKKYGSSPCGDSSDQVFYVQTPDCSNVDACATESCQMRPKYDGTPARNLIVFAECNSSGALDGSTLDGEDDVNSTFKNGGAAAPSSPTAAPRATQASGADSTKSPVISGAIGTSAADLLVFSAVFFAVVIMYF